MDFCFYDKKLNAGRFSWPRTTTEALDITPEQYGMLMQGLEIIAKKPIIETNPTKLC